MSRLFKGTSLEFCQRHLFHGTNQPAVTFMLLEDRSITPLCEECATLLRSGPIQEERGRLRLFLSLDTHNHKEAT